MSGCMPRSDAMITVPKMANSKLTAKQSSVPINVTRPTRTGMVYQRGARDVAADVIRSGLILMVRTALDPVRPVSAESMDGSDASSYFTAMPHASGNEALLSGADRRPLFAAVLLISDQGVAALDHNHVFIELVHMRRRGRGLGAGPESHLAAIHSVKDIAFDAGSRLAAGGDPVGWLLHELGKVLHIPPLFFSQTRVKILISLRLWSRTGVTCPQNIDSRGLAFKIFRSEDLAAN